MSFKAKVYGILGTVKLEEEFETVEERRIWLKGFKAGIDYRKSTKFIIDAGDESAEILIGRIFH